ncbi:hypothetical protein [Streptomyces sp. NPDC048350]|uniref:hypothetical protein n=1 Tax=Streptomyces sp. NPDC048350 TaxID=3365538 RepID=UPI00371D62B7
MTDPTRCLRPTCNFSPSPALTEAGGLVVDPYCSLVCRLWTEYAVQLAQAPSSPRAEWESRQMFVMDEVLNNRAHPSDIDQEII